MFNIFKRLKNLEKSFSGIQSAWDKKFNELSGSITGRYGSIKQEVTKLTERVYSLEQANEILAKEVLKLQPKPKVKSKKK